MTGRWPASRSTRSSTMFTAAGVPTWPY
jgi:hypothetical protein